MKLRTRITLIILEIGLIPIIMLGYVAYNNSYKRVEQITKDNLSNLAELKVDAIRHSVNEYDRIMQIISKNEQLAIDLKSEISRPSKTTQTALQNQIKSIAKTTDDIERVNLISLQGKVIVSSDPSFVGRDVSKEDSFLIGQKGPNTALIGHAQDFEDEHLLHQCIVSPIESNGEIIGVVEIITRAEKILEVINNYNGLGKTGETLLVKDDGEGNALFIAPTRFDPDAALKRKNPKESQNIPSVRTITDKKDSLYWGDYVDYRNERVYGAGRYIPEYGWGVVVKINRSEFEAPFVNTRQVTIFIVIGAVVVIFLIGASIARIVSDQILELQKRLLEEQSHAEAKLFSRWLSLNEAMLSSIGDGIMVVNKKGNITYINKAFEDILGFNSREVLEKPVDKIILRQDDRGESQISSYASILKQILSGKTLTTTTTTTTTTNFVKKDGKTVTVTSVISPMTVSGKVVGAVESFRDVTKEQQIDRAKSEFVSLAAHQLRTPLTSINWYVESLRTDKEVGNFSKRQKSYLSEVYSASIRMVELIDAMLHVSRMELGTIVLNCQKVDLIKLAKDMINQLKPEIKQKKIKLISSYATNIPSYTADIDLTNIIFQNLLTNALRYTPEGGQIHLSIHSKKNGEIFGGKKITQKSYGIVVKDSGIGIPKEQQSKIFTKMFRADNAKKHEQNGNGLGLYLVKKIVQMDKGDIWFDSKEGKGTIFYVLIPTQKIVTKHLDLRKKKVTRKP